MKEIMKRHAWIFPLAVVGIAVFASLGISRPAAEDSASQQNGSKAALALKLLQKTRGEVIFTAAINSDGTVARCYNCIKLKTLHLGIGQYQVAFSGNVQANLGASRWVRPDTLSTGSVFTWCDTADRSGVTNAVWVNCQNASGLVDTSFFLFVAK